MAQEDKSTQSPKETLDTSTQPVVRKVKDLDLEVATEAKEAPMEQELSSDEEQPATEERSQETGNDKLVELLQEQKATIDELKKGLYNQGRKISEKLRGDDEEEESEAELTDEESKAKEVLRNMGFVDKDALRREMESLAKKQADEKSLDDICRINPNIDKKLLKSLGKVDPNKAWEDIIVEYNLNRGDKLNKAHDRPVMGRPIDKSPERQKTPFEMSDAEFRAFLKENSSGKIHSSYI